MEGGGQWNSVYCWKDSPSKPDLNPVPLAQQADVQSTDFPADGDKRYGDSVDLCKIV